MQGPFYLTVAVVSPLPWGEAVNEIAKRIPELAEAHVELQFITAMGSTGGDNPLTEVAHYGGGRS
jgi:hypothetical protein